MDTSLLESKLFTPAQLGPITLRNRVIRAAAFEGMGHENNPTQELHDYHVAVAKGGVGMTTLAYAAIVQSGLSFPTQLWLRPEVVPQLRAITDDIHKEGAAASIQTGHCGNMSHRSICGCLPIGPGSGFNLYSPTFVRGMRTSEVTQMVKDFGKAVHLAHEAGFDAIEIHAGHGYLLSQFMSTRLNHRKDAYGGSFENRTRFAREAVAEVMEAAAQHQMAVLVKMNMRDGFKGGMEVDEALLVAKQFEALGVHALVLSGGYVSRAPMFVMRGAMPIRTLSHYMPFGYLKYGVRMAGRLMIPPVPFKEGYFMELAKTFRKELHVPLVCLGGMSSRAIIEEALNENFEFIGMARALIEDTDFVNKMRRAQEEGNGASYKSACRHTNYCIARMYSLNMKCHQHRSDVPDCLLAELKRNEKKYCY